MKYTVEGSAPNFSDAEGMTIERGAQVRLRIKGIRGELGQMFAIGSIREDYLGYDSRVTMFGLLLLTPHISGHCYSSYYYMHAASTGCLQIYFN